MGTTVGQKVDTVLHDIIAVGILAASIFVKNAAHQETASKLIQAVGQLLPMLDNQLNPQNPTPGTATSPTAPVTTP